MKFTFKISCTEHSSRLWSLLNFEGLLLLCLDEEKHDVLKSKKGVLRSVVSGLSRPNAGAQSNSTDEVRL